MKIRKIHGIIGIIFSPFILITGFGAIILLLRKTGMFSHELIETIVNIHNYEIIGNYVGIILELALIFQAVTGVIMFVGIMNARKKAQKVKAGK